MNKIVIKQNENGWSAYSQNEKIMQDYESQKEAYYYALGMYLDWTVKETEDENDFSCFFVEEE